MKQTYPNLRAEMKKRGDTQETLANLLFMDKSNISRRFTGITQWGIGEIDTLCEYYGKDYYYLFK